MDDRTVFKIAVSQAVVDALEDAAEEENRRRLESRPAAPSSFDIRPADVAANVLRGWMLSRLRK